jgi:predicted RNase H-like nuclease (RuvC/YqgF family)
MSGKSVDKGLLKALTSPKVESVPTPASAKKSETRALDISSFNEIVSASKRFKQEEEKGQEAKIIELTKTVEKLAHENAVLRGQLQKSEKTQEFATLLMNLETQASSAHQEATRHEEDAIEYKAEVDKLTAKIAEYEKKVDK